MKFGSVPQSTGSPVAEGSRGGHSTGVLLVDAVISILVAYAVSMLIPAIPIIQKDFAASATTTAWITSGFLIVGTGFSPLFGKLGDVYGKKKMLLVALSCFTFGIGLAGFSPSIYVLVFSMSIAGIGFAMLPLMLGMVNDVFPKERVATAQGLIMAGAAIGGAVGLVGGSYVVQDLGWRFLFYTSLVGSVVLLCLAAGFLKEARNLVKGRVDYGGAFLLMGGVALLLLYLSEGSSLGWLSAENGAFLMLGLLLVTAFFAFERRRESPLIQLGLLRVRNVLVGNVVGMVAGLGNFLLFYAFVYYAELPPPFGLGLDILSTGLALVPATLVMFVVGPIMGRVVTKAGPRPVLLIGAFTLALGFLVFIYGKSANMGITVDGVIAFAGIVAMIVPIVNMITTSLPQDNVSTGVGINTMLQNLGKSIGPVLATTIMTAYTGPLTKVIGGKSVVVANLPNATAFNTIASIGIVLTIIVMVLSLVIRNYRFSGKS